MESIGLVLLSRQSALQRQVEVIANNVANTNTAGYKAQRLLVQNQPLRTQFDDTLNYVIDRATLRDTNSGAMVRTGNELDFALQGAGYFGVRTKQGVQYTRNGSFSLNSNGDLVTQDGDTVLSNDGQPLNVPQDASQLSIDANGRLLSDKGEIGRLKVAAFKQEQAMIETGHGLYKANQPEQEATETRIVQGAIEQSNVRPVIEMTRLTEAVRAYQQTANMMQSEHDRLRTAIRTLGRVSAA